MLACEYAYIFIYVLFFFYFVFDTLGSHSFTVISAIARYRSVSTDLYPKLFNINIGSSEKRVANVYIDTCARI